MNNFSPVSGAATLDSIRSDLDALLLQVPVYASWRRDDLKFVCERYANILIWVAWWDNYRDRCSDLLRTLPLIQEHVLHTLECDDWRSFNMASSALEWDLKELIGIVG